MLNRIYNEVNILPLESESPIKHHSSENSWCKGKQDTMARVSFTWTSLSTWISHHYAAPPTFP